jgi:hypothetical protein
MPLFDWWDKIITSLWKKNSSMKQPGGQHGNWDFQAEFAYILVYCQSFWFPSWLVLALTQVTIHILFHGIQEGIYTCTGNESAYYCVSWKHHTNIALWLYNRPYVFKKGTHCPLIAQKNYIPQLSWHCTWVFSLWIWFWHLWIDLYQINFFFLTSSGRVNSWWYLWGLCRSVFSNFPCSNFLANYSSCALLMSKGMKQSRTCKQEYKR